MVRVTAADADSARAYELGGDIMMNANVSVEYAKDGDKRTAKNIVNLKDK